MTHYEGYLPVDTPTHLKTTLYGIWTGLAGGSMPAWKWHQLIIPQIKILKEYQYYGAAAKLAARVPWNTFPSVPCDGE